MTNENYTVQSLNAKKKIPYSLLSDKTRSSIQPNTLRTCLSAQWAPSQPISINCKTCMNRGYISSSDMFTPCPMESCTFYGQRVHKIILGSRYKLGKLNGAGSFSRSYWGYDTLYCPYSSQDGDQDILNDKQGLVSIKITHQKYSSIALRESKILKHIQRHDSYCLFRVVRLLEVFSIPPNFVCQVFEPLENWNHSIMQLPGGINSQFKIEYMSKMAHQLLSSICFIHELGFIHADIKPENILYGENPSGIRIIDFGNALTQEDLSIHDYHYDTIQSLRYRAPEVLLGNSRQIGNGIDIWSIGCILSEILLGHALLERALDIPSVWMEILSLHGPLPLSLIEGSVHQSTYLDSLELFYQSIRDHRPVYNHYLYNAKSFRSKLSRLFQVSDMYLVDLVARLLDPVPQTRITAADALNHPFLMRYHIPSVPMDHLIATGSTSDPRTRYIL